MWKRTQPYRRRSKQRLWQCRIGECQRREQATQECRIGLTVRRVCETSRRREQQIKNKSKLVEQAKKRRRRRTGRLLKISTGRIAKKQECGRIRRSRCSQRAMADETARPASPHIQDQMERRLSKAVRRRKRLDGGQSTWKQLNRPEEKKRAGTRGNCVRCEEHNFLDGVVDLDSDIGASVLHSVSRSEVGARRRKRKSLVGELTRTRKTASKTTCHKRPELFTVEGKK